MLQRVHLTWQDCQAQCGWEVSDRTKAGCSFLQGLHVFCLLLSPSLPLKEVKEHPSFLQTLGNKSVVPVLGRYRPKEQESKLMLNYITSSSQSRIDDESLISKQNKTKLFGKNPEMYVSVISI